VAGAKTLEQANTYLEREFVPWWNQHLVVIPAHPTDAHRALGPEHNLAASLSVVETRQVANDYTLRFHQCKCLLHVHAGLIFAHWISGACFSLSVKNPRMLYAC
jgi:hypothetical protein